MYVKPSDSFMGNKSLFYEYYDQLFGTKEYGQETSCVLKMAAANRSGALSKILEIGCGTARHTLELASRNIPVFAVDIDPHMLAKARENIDASGLANITLHHGPVDTLAERDFPLALALFNVITYIPDQEGLRAFMLNVYEKLVPGGMFIFDCWNGIAAILDPPQSKNFATMHHNKRITCHLSSRTDFFQQRTMLDYAITVSDAAGKVIGQETHSFSQTLWTPQQIRFAVLEAGFAIHACCPAFQPEKRASAQDWKIMFACQKG